MSRRTTAIVLFAATALCVCVPAFARAQVAPLRPSAAAGADPDRFRSTVFATGLHFPYGMQKLADGSLLVATSRPLPENGSYFASTGELVRLVDADGDGVSDRAPLVVLKGLPGALTALAAAGKLVFVTSSQPGAEQITVLRRNSTPYGYMVAGRLSFTFPASWWHTTYGLAAVANGDEYRLYFNVGSSDNAAQSEQTVTVSGLVSAQLEGASVYELRLTLTSGQLRATSLRQVASGLRNAAGLALDANGDLLLADNGIDGLVNVDEPHSADELNVLTAADLATPAVESFGFPDTYVEYRTGTHVGSEGVPPVTAFQPIGNTAAESEGAAQVALAPAGFPPGFDQGAFVGFHGRFDQGGLANEENPVVYVDHRTGEYAHFIGNDEPDVGHLDGLLSTMDSLFLADMSRTGSLGPEAAGNGVIYQIRAR